MLFRANLACVAAALILTLAVASAQRGRLLLDEEEAPPALPPNQYVGIAEDFQFYVPTVESSGGQRPQALLGGQQPQHRFAAPSQRLQQVQYHQQDASGYSNLPTSPLIGASLVSITPQNVPEEEYVAEDDDVVVPGTRNQRLSVQEEEAKLRRRLEVIRRQDQELRQSLIRQLEEEELEKMRQTQQAHLDAPAPVQTLTDYVHIAPQHQNQRNHHHQHQQQQQHLQNHHQHQQQQQPQHQDHIIRPRIKTPRPRIDPFADLRNQAEPNRRPQPQHPQQHQHHHEPEPVGQSLFLRVGATEQPQDRRPSPVVQQPVRRPAAQDPALEQRRRQYEEEVFRKQSENAKYEFASGVQDDIYGNNQERQEVRDGNSVKGKYSFSDGYYRRTVYYEADEKGYRVVKEDVEPLGDGPQVNPRGAAVVSAYVDGNEVNYQITGDDIQRRQSAPPQHQISIN